jgi:hypothetical protein
MQPRIFCCSSSSPAPIDLYLVLKPSGLECKSTGFLCIMASYREYDPEQSSRTKRIPPHVWDEMRPFILELYLTEDHPVEKVASDMAARHGFEARSEHGLSQKGFLLTVLSARQYRFTLQKWKITKNTPSHVMRCAARKLHEKPQRHDFEYKGKAILPLDISRFQTRYPGFDSASSPTACRYTSCSY